jgi:hypothetical protein
VTLPILSTGIKERGHLARHGINAGEIWTFSVVAEEAGKREVFAGGLPAVFTSNDMVDLEPEDIAILWHLAVFAAMLGPLPDEPLK